MKHLLTLILAMGAFALSACSQSKTDKGAATGSNEARKALVVYFSATGTTKQAAGLLAEAAHADIHEIVPEQPYTAADLDWTDKQSRSTVEMQNPKSRPAIKGKPIDATAYDTVYVGFPIWWNMAPTIINTFVEQTDLKGKVLVVFATSGGNTTANATSELKKAYPTLNWKDGGLLNSRTQEEAQQLVDRVK